MLNMFSELKKRERILAKSWAENLEHIFFKELKENSRSEKVQLLKLSQKSICGLDDIRRKYPNWSKERQKEENTEECKNV